MKTHCSAYTVLETLVVLSILAMVLISIPPLWNWLRIQDIGHAADQLSGDLHLARMMAIRHKTTCAVRFNTPGSNQYTNALDGKKSDLSVYQGNVRFLARGPDGRKMSSQIMFNPRGMTPSVIPMDVFITDRDRRRIYRLRILSPGGITTDRWIDNRWQ